MCNLFDNCSKYKMASLKISSSFPVSGYHIFTVTASFAHSVDHMFSLYVDYFNFSYFPF